MVLMELYAKMSMIHVMLLVSVDVFLQFDKNKTGSKMCVHGDCINDQYFFRGFACQCDENYHGLNCDVEIGWSSVLYNRITVIWNG